MAMGDHLWHHRWSGKTIYGSRTWSGGPSTATYFAADGPGDLFWGDHLWHDRANSSDFCLQELRWPALQARRNYFSVSFVHDILHKRVSLSFEDHFHFSTSCSRSHHLALTILPSTIHPYSYSFSSTHLSYGTQFHSRSSNYPTTSPFVLRYSCLGSNIRNAKT